MPLTTPQQQAGVLSFYDAPEKGPEITARVLLVAAAVFIIVIMIFDHAALFAT